jgi:enamine deaminase RidA (YjgF/YER057c/UK114 family)
METATETEHAMASNIRRVNPTDVHPPTGYTHAVEVNGGKLVYISGQVAFNAEGKLVGEGDMAAQTEQVFQNLKGALAAVGADFSHVVKLNYYATDASQVAAVREVRARYLGEDPPASTFVIVSALVLPTLLIEIEAVAAIL